MTDIAINEVQVNFGFNRVLDGVSFEIQSGEKAAIVGNNGTGKTTLFRVIAGLETCDYGKVTLRKGVTLGYLEQNSNIEADNLTVLAYLKGAQKDISALESEMRKLEESMATLTGSALDKTLKEYDRLQNRFYALDGYAAEENFNKICSVFKLDEDRLRQSCGALSGGQRTIVKLAHVLLTRPDILLLDEPTNHIDIDAVKWLEEFIRAYSGTVVVVSHDRYFMDRAVTKTVLLEEGRATVFNGNYTFCLREQERLMMLEIEQYKNAQKQIEAMKAAIKRFREWGARGDNKRMFRRADNMEKRLTLLEEATNRPRAERGTLPLAFNAGKRSGKRVLTVRDICFSYGGEPVLNGVGFDILFKDRICLMGANGSGKTTLLRIILNQLTATQGEVTVGESVRPGYVEQVVRFENENETLLEAFKYDAAVHENEARRILARYFFNGDAVYKRLAALSGGERVIVKLSMLMQKSVNFLIMDEPTNHLDIDTKEMLEEALAEYGGTLLYVSHDRYFINKTAGRIAYLENGTLTLYEGNYDALNINR